MQAAKGRAIRNPTGETPIDTIEFALVSKNANTHFLDLNIFVSRGFDTAVQLIMRLGIKQRYASLDLFDCHLI